MKRRIEEGWVVDFNGFYHTFLVINGGTHWTGGRYSSFNEAESICERYMGKVVPEDEWIGDINDYVDFGDEWENIRCQYINGNLGSPLYSYNGQSKNISCSCDNRMIMLHGCPSAYGNACPDRQWEGYY